MYFLVTVSRSDPGADPPLDGTAAGGLLPTTTLRELQQEHVVAGCWRRLDAAEVYLLVEAGDAEEMWRALARLDPARGRTTLAAVPVEAW